MRLDVRLGPAAKGSRAARGVHKRDNDAQQDEEEENTRVVGNCGDEAVVDDCVQRGDGGKVCCKQRADDNAIAQALIIAQRSADEILAKANANATETIQDARDEAQRIIDRANTDRQDVIDATARMPARSTPTC